MWCGVCVVWYYLAVGCQFKNIVFFKIISQTSPEIRNVAIMSQARHKQDTKCRKHVTSETQNVASMSQARHEMSQACRKHWCFCLKAKQAHCFPSLSLGKCTCKPISTPQNTRRTAHTLRALHWLHFSIHPRREERGCTCKLYMIWKSSLDHSW